MVSAVESIFKSKKLSYSEIINWLQTFIIEYPKNSYISNFHLKVNLKYFLRSLYFGLLEEYSLYFVIEEIIKLLKKL